MPLEEEEYASAAVVRMVVASVVSSAIIAMATMSGTRGRRAGGGILRYLSPCIDEMR